MIRKIIILMGPPGAGKGTQGEAVAKELAIPHVAAGDIMRKIIEDKVSPYYETLVEHIPKGKLAPDNIVNKIIRDCMLSDKYQAGCLLDGYPRTTRQAEVFIESFDAEIISIFLELEDEIAIQRIAGRINCASCDKPYNKHDGNMSSDRKCENCNSTQFSTRTDDDVSVVQARLEEYRKSTLPMINYYKNMKRFFTVDANQSKEQVLKDILFIVKRV